MMSSNPQLIQLQSGQPIKAFLPFLQGGGNQLLPFKLGAAPTRSCGSFRKNHSHGKVLRVRTPAIKAEAVAFPGLENPVAVKAVVTVQPTSNLGLSRGLDDIQDMFGKTLLVELVSAELDPKTGIEKGRISAYAHKVRGKDNDDVQYEADFQVPAEFGEIGAVAVENEHHKEMFLKDIVLDGLLNGALSISCNSWVHSKFNDPLKRIFFTNKSYLPSETPSGLRRMRKVQLETTRGNGVGQRKSFERIYDYDVYNDLGDPDSDPDKQRPVLGGKQHPYPRRCRTGRARCKNDPLSETRKGSWYVPRDEAFSDVKQLTFSAKTVYSVAHAVIPALQTALVDAELGFPYFTAIDQLFDEGIELPPGKTHGILNAMLPRLIKAIGDTTDNVLRFETPQTMDRDKFLWFRDEEFARQTLAGLNPCSIRLVTEWPLKSNLDPAVYGPPESAITKEMIEEQIRFFMTLEEVYMQ